MLEDVLQQQDSMYADVQVSATANTELNANINVSGNTVTYNSDTMVISGMVIMGVVAIVFLIIL